MADFKSLTAGRLAVVACAAWLALGAGPQPSRYKIASGTVTFTAIGKPGFLRVNGRGAVSSGNFSLDSGKKGLSGGEVTVKLDAFETGIALRDRHMKENYLETSRFPEAKLVMAPLTFTGATIPDAIDLKGDLTLHGKSQTVSAAAKIKQKDDQLEVESAFDLKLSDFGISIPEYAGITVADTVKVSVKISAVPEKAGEKKK